MAATEDKFYDLFGPVKTDLDEATASYIRKDLMHHLLPPSQTHPVFDGFVVFVRRIFATLRVSEDNWRGMRDNIVLRYALQDSSKLNEKTARRQQEHIIKSLDGDGFFARQNHDRVPSSNLLTYLNQGRTMADFWSWPEFKVTRERTVRAPPGSGEWKTCSQKDLPPTSMDVDRGHYLDMDCSNRTISALGSVQAFVNTHLGPVADRDGSRHVRVPLYNRDICMLNRPDKENPWPVDKLGRFTLASLTYWQDAFHWNDSNKRFYVLVGVVHESGAVRTYSESATPIDFGSRDMVESWVMRLGRPRPAGGAFLLLYRRPQGIHMAPINPERQNDSIFKVEEVLFEATQDGRELFEIAPEKAQEDPRSQSQHQSAQLTDGQGHPIPTGRDQGQTHRPGANRGRGDWSRGGQPRGNRSRVGQSRVGQSRGGQSRGGRSRGGQSQNDSFESGSGRGGRQGGHRGQAQDAFGSQESRGNSRSRQRRKKGNSRP